MSYKAFISYSHAADGQLAPALQTALQKFAKPFYRLRALRLFRDETSLHLTPKLWPTIQQSIAESEFFILMASPDSARSHWVQQEVGEWLRLREGSLDKFLIVLTEGEILWSPILNDFDWEKTTAIPQTLNGKFSVEPLFLDFRWARHEEHLSLRNPQFLKSVGRVAAVLHNKSLDLMIGEDVRQHRLFRVLSVAAIAVLIALVLVASMAALYANSQKEEAIESQRQAVISKNDAIASRDTAQMEKMKAEEAAAAAIRAQKEEARQRVIADSARMNETEARVLAEDRRKEAEKQTRIAVAQRRAAVLQKEAAENNLYNAHIRAVQQNVTTGNFEDAKTLLQNYLPAPKQRDLRSFEWYYLWQQLHREKGSFPHPGDVSTVLFSPDGSRLATLSKENETNSVLSVWDVDAQKLLAQRKIRSQGNKGNRAYMPYGNPKSSLAFSPDSKLLAVTEELPAPTPNDGTWPKSKTRLNVWEITDNGRVFTLNEQSTLTLNLTGVDFIEFFPNSRKLLVVQSDRGTERGDRDDSTRLIFVDRIAPHITDSPLVWRGLSKSVTLSKDGKYVAVVNADSLNVIDTESSGERVKKYGGSVYLHWFYAAVFSPDSRKLAVVQTTGEIKFIDPSTGKEVSSLPAGLKKAVHSENVFLKFSPDGNLLVEKDGDNYIRVWNVVDRKELYTYYGNLRADIADIGFSKTGKIMAVGSSDSSVTLWRVEPEYTVVTGNLVSFRPVFSPDGKTIAIKKRIPVKRKAVTDRTQAPVVDLLDLETLNLRARFPIRFLARSTFAQGNSVAFSPDGKTLAVGGLDGIIELWDLLTNKKKHEFRGLDSGHIEGVKINNIGFTEDGSRLSAHNRLGLMKVWDLVTGKVLLRKENVFGLAFSSRKKRMAVATTDGTVELKETLDFRTLRMFKNDKRASLQFLPDGNTLAIFGKRETIPAVLDFKFIDAENGRIKIHRQQPYIKPIKSFSFTPDGKTMATGLADGTVKLWSLSNFEELISLKIGDEYSEGVSVEFSPDGRFMSIGNPFGTRLGLLRAAAKEKVSAKQ